VLAAARARQASIKRRRTRTGTNLGPHAAVVQSAAEAPAATARGGSADPRDQNAVPVLGAQSTTRPPTVRLNQCRAAEWATASTGYRHKFRCLRGDLDFKSMSSGAPPYKRLIESLR